MRARSPGSAAVCCSVLLFVCGWTGYVMVWDTFGQHLAREGARMLDALPDPVRAHRAARSPANSRVPSAFFFVNLFAHIGIPLAMGVVLWLHVKRLARPRCCRRAAHVARRSALLTAAADRPARRHGAAGRPVRPARADPVDLFFAFWMPDRAATRRRRRRWSC